MPAPTSPTWLHKLGPAAADLLAKLRRTVQRGQPTLTPTLSDDNPNRYFDPDILARVGFDPLLAKLVVEGFIAGLHKSPFHGVSVDFADHREYVPGDDLKFIDWALYARTDHYYIKRFEDETNLRCTILLDHSASMAFGTGQLTKWDYGCFLASCLAYLMLRQQDAVGMGLFGAQAGALVPTRARRSHLQQLMKVMIDHAPTGETSLAASLEQIIARLKRRGLVVVISDLIDDPDATLAALRLLGAHRHEVIVFHVVDPAEAEFPFEGPTLFRDMESGEELEIDPGAVREHYIQRLGQLHEFYAKGLTDVGIDYHRLDTRQRYDGALRAYLDRRRRMRG